MVSEHQIKTPGKTEEPHYNLAEAEKTSVILPPTQKQFTKEQQKFLLIKLGSL